MELKDTVRQLVKDELKKQINPQQEQDETVEEGTASVIRGVSGLAAVLASLAGGTATAISMDPWLFPTTVIASMALFNAGEAVAKKVADAGFRRSMDNLKKATFERDEFIRAALAQDDPKEYLWLHEKDVKKLTLKAKKAGQAIRRFLQKEKTNRDASRILSGLTAGERKNLESLVDRAEAGILTMVNGVK